MVDVKSLDEKSLTADFLARCYLQNVAFIFVYHQLVHNHRRACSISLTRARNVTRSPRAVVKFIQNIEC